MHTASTKEKVEKRVQCELALLGKASRRRDLTEDINQLEGSQARRYYSSFGALAFRRSWQRLWQSLSTPNRPVPSPTHARTHTRAHTHTHTHTGLCLPPRTYTHRPVPSPTHALTHTRAHTHTTPITRNQGKTDTKPSSFIRGHTHATTFPIFALCQTQKENRETGRELEEWLE